MLCFNKQNYILLNFISKEYNIFKAHYLTTEVAEMRRVTQSFANG
jgi:hypothetical protein